MLPICIGVLLSIALGSDAQSFYLGQKWPVYSETSSVASGPSGGTITRDSLRFDDELVKNTNANIVFKQEEGTDADKYMTPRCRNKANTLAILVSQEWSGVQLRVTEAWDEDYEHSANSLHYSGRALDITTSDIDYSKYGRLAQLAADAAFDWVYYEAADHVHVSCKADPCSSDEFQCSNGQCIFDIWYCDSFNDCDDNSDEPNICSCTSNQFACSNGQQCIPDYWECDGLNDCSDHSDEGSQCSSTTSAPTTAAPPSFCFPPNALAQTENGPVALKDIKLGSNILAMDSTGTLVYSPVIAMLDAKDDEVANYTMIRTVDHHQLVLTPAHLIYKTDYDNKMSASEVTIPESPVFASTVKKGDIVFVAADDKTINPEKVASVVVKPIRGAYAPLTKEGNMVINDILVSCYAIVNDYNLAHNSFAPLRYLYDTLPGVVIGSSQTKGIHWYPQMLMNIAEIFLDETSYYPMGVKEVLNVTIQ